MQQVKINKTEYRRWRENRTVLMNDKGEAVRYASNREANQIAKAALKGVNLRIKEGEVLLTGLSDRELMQKEMLALFGECQIRLFNGVKLKVVRDDKLERPKMSDADQSAPSPEHCQCRKWVGRKAGRHHWTCHWNQFAPENQKGEMAAGVMDADPENAPVAPEGSSVVKVYEGKTIPLSPEENLTLSKLTTIKRPPPAVRPGSFTSVPVAAAPIPEPSTCVCSKWQRRPEDTDQGHHYMCEWYDAWNMKDHPGFYLYALNDLENPLRRANMLEAIEAERGGVSRAKIDGVEYEVRGLEPPVYFGPSEKPEEHSAPVGA